MLTHLQQQAERPLGRHSKLSIQNSRLMSPLPGLRVLQQGFCTDLAASIYEPVVCLILQGKKETTLGDEPKVLNVGDCLLVSHDVPVVSRVIKAPYLALLLTVDIDTVRGLYDDLGAAPLDDEAPHAMRAQPATPALLDALCRYFMLTDAPADAGVLGPMIRRELHYRLLTDPIGATLRGLIRYDSPASLVARAIAVLRRDFRESLSVAELAREVGMSVSSFHRHFKSVTSLAPLQYQKELRLVEAQKMLATGTTVSMTSLEVGYESLSQFSREYARKFGRSPSRESTQSSARRTHS
jgi:AraC-like DNA-binding protein